MMNTSNTHLQTLHLSCLGISLTSQTFETIGFDSSKIWHLLLIYCEIYLHFIVFRLTTVEVATTDD